MLSKFFNKKSRGFTLVELLIVVAIIGVLSTLGVPTFRRMIQKSKKSEAKVNLGALFTAESAFRAEYNTYGNNLGRLGFEIEGTPANMTYTIGFVADAACAGQAAIAPAVTEATGVALNGTFPAYYGGAWAPASAIAGYNGNVAASAGCTAAVGSTVAADGNTFQAMAAGVVAPGIDRTQPAAGQTDVWTMNQGRVLQNIQDGVL